MLIITKACREVEQLIKNQNLVIVTGHSGSGKSAIIKHIALKYRRQGWLVKLVYGVQDILNLYQSVLQNKTIFVLNDPIGQSVLDEKAYGSWEKHEETLIVCLNKIKLLISCRKYILVDEKVKGLLSKKSNIIDINDDKYKLHNDEKRKIFNIHACDKKISEEEFVELFEIEEYFPLLCKLYFSKDRKQSDDLLIFFKEPIRIVEEEIRSFKISSKEKYCALVLITLLNIFPSVDDLRENKNYNEKFKLALELCGMQECTQPHIIADALKTLNGYFVMKIGETYQFNHDFVMEATTFVLGTDYQTVAIKYADVSFLRKSVRIEIRSNPFIIYVNENLIDRLGDRLFTELFGERFLEVVLNPCLKNETIAQVFIKNLKCSPEKFHCLLEKKDPVYKYEERENKRPIATILSSLKNRGIVSPLCALIAYSNVHLALHCLETLVQMKTNFKNSSLLSAVCCNGSLDLFRFFLKDPLKECLTKLLESSNCIVLVCLFYNFEILQELIQLGVDVNSSFRDDELSPLMSAVLNDPMQNVQQEDKHPTEEKRNKTIQLLLSKEALVNENVFGLLSPLMCVCSKGYDSIVKLLLRHEADINLCDKYGMSPIFFSSKNGHCSTFAE